MVLAFPSLDSSSALKSCGPPKAHRGGGKCRSSSQIVEEGAAVVLMIAWRWCCSLFLSAVVVGQRPPRSGPKARRSKGRRDGARRLEDTAAPTSRPTPRPPSTPTTGAPTYWTPAPFAAPSTVPTPEWELHQGAGYCAYSATDKQDLYIGVQESWTAAVAFCEQFAPTANWVEFEGGLNTCAVSWCMYVCPCMDSVGESSTATQGDALATLSCHEDPSFEYAHVDCDDAFDACGSCADFLANPSCGQAHGCPDDFSSMLTYLCEQCPDNMDGLHYTAGGCAGKTACEALLTPTRVPTATPTAVPTARPTSEPTFFTWAPTPVPACCVEQQFDATGDVVGTSCYHGRSPWEESTMADLCTAGHSDAGAVAPPFRDCSQAAMDAGSCGGDPAVYDMRAAMRKFKFRGAFTLEDDASTFTG